jgi:hypothetical protein
VSSNGETTVYFNDLNPNEHYVASVARTEVGSLFGITERPFSLSGQLGSGIGSSLTANPTSVPNSTTQVVSPRSECEDAILLNVSEHFDEGGIETPEERDPSADSVNRQQGDNSVDKGLNQSNVERQLAFEEDMKAWDSWNDEALHLPSSQSTATLRASILVCGSKAIRIAFANP